MKISPLFWKNKKVFITGHTGFKGSWLSVWLQQMGSDVFGYALEPHTTPNLYTLGLVQNHMKSMIGDIRNFGMLSAAINNFKPDIIFHMAAQALVKQSYLDPIDTYSTNILGTANLLEAVRHADSVRAVINVTSDKCYENKEWYWGYRENEPLGGKDPYSSSKACAELITTAYWHSFFEKKLSKVGLASARAGNVIGGGDWASDRLVPDILNAHFENKTIKIRSPHATRPWQHVLEPLSGYLLLAENVFDNSEVFSGSWNFGPLDADVMSVISLIECVRTIISPADISIEFDYTTKFHEASLLKLDCSKAKQFLGWKPRAGLLWALQKTFEWHQAYLNKENMRIFTIKQIEEYMKIL